MTDATLRLAASVCLLAALLGGCDSGEDTTANPVPPPPGPTVGLDQRPSNTTCLAPARSTGNVNIGVQRVFANLPAFSQPVAILQAPRDDTRWFVVEQGGVVRVFENIASVAASSPFIDIDDGRLTSGGETGLLGMAFHPNFPTDPRVYLSYTTPGPLRSRISEFTSPDGGLTLNPNSERILLTINQPESNHNGGGIAFGPDDDFLYLGMGDGGGGNDQHGTIGNGQRLTTLLGKMIRIDISAGAGGMLYRIPGDNPFAGNAPCGANGTGSANCPEIFAWGLRNPWRWSFDRQNGALWVGDVGQNAIEEVGRVILGGNYGWRCFEGTRNTGLCTSLPTNALPPVAEYGRSVGVTVTGGYVYRGQDFPALFGRYVFADVGTARLFHIASDTQPTLTVTGGLNTGLAITSFGEANDGELYAVDYGGGGLYQITGSGGGGGSAVATQLSATGCVSAANATQPASGLIPYAPNAAFWSDGATKERWIALPNGQNITVNANGDWDFPNGTVLVKNFRLGNQLVETRHFMRHPDGVWAGYTYEWNAQQTEAALVTGGKQVTVAGQPWIFPSEAQCLQCHTSAAGRSLGLENLQLAHPITYPQTGRNAHQLVTLNAINVLSPPVADPTTLTPYPDPAGSTGTLTERARSYLHTNCGGCHRQGGPTPSNMDLRYSVTLNATNVCGVAPTLGDLGIANARLIAPGDAARSVLIARMNRRDANGMPPVGSAQVDTAGATLLTDWVNSLANCN